MSQTPESMELEDLLRRIPRHSAPAGLWDRIQTELRSQTTHVPPRVTKRLVSPWLVAAAITLAVTGGVIVGDIRSYGAPGSWAVLPLSGTPLVGESPLTGAGALTAGEWLTTDATSRAELSVGRIGVAEVGPGSRVRLERGGWTEHRLTLERGSLSAAISAPPRLFFVQTPSALVTDLGCAYTLDVDSMGVGRLHVTAGWVELRKNDVVSVVPAGLMAEVEVAGKPGTPYPREMSGAAQAALHRLDAGTGDAADLDLVLEAQYTASHFVILRERSAITLWHLLQRVDTERRGVVYERLASLSPLPAGVTREGILGLDRPMLDRWLRDLSPMWSKAGLSESWWTRLSRRALEWVM